MTTPELVAFIKKNPIGVGCGALCLALAAGLYFRSSEMPAAEAELEEKSAQATRYSANLKNGVQLKEQLEELVAANKEIDARLLRVGQFGTNSQFFYKVVAETGVNLTDFRQNTTAPTKGKPFTQVNFAVSVQGELPQLLQFLRLLESGAHYSRILTASLSGASQRSAPLTLSLTLEILGAP